MLKSHLALTLHRDLHLSHYSCSSFFVAEEVLLSHFCYIKLNLNPNLILKVAKIRLE